MTRRGPFTRKAERLSLTRLRWVFYPALAAVLAAAAIGVVHLLGLMLPVAGVLWLVGLGGVVLVLEVVFTRLSAAERYAQTLKTLIEAVAQEGDAPALAQAIITWAQSHLGAAAGAVFLTQPQGGLDLLAAVVANGYTVPRPGNGERHAVAAALRSGAPVVVAQAADDAWLAHLAVGLPMTSTGMCVPLTIGGRPRGVLALVLRGRPPDTAVLQFVGQIAGLALEARSTVGMPERAAPSNEAVAVPPVSSPAPALPGEKLASGPPEQRREYAARAGEAQGETGGPVATPAQPRQIRAQFLEVTPLTTAAAVAQFMGAVERLPGVLRAELQSFARGRAVFLLEIASLPDLLRGLPLLPRFEGTTVDLQGNRIQLRLEEGWPGSATPASGGPPPNPPLREERGLALEDQQQQGDPPSETWETRPPAMLFRSPDNGRVVAAGVERPGPSPRSSGTWPVGGQEHQIVAVRPFRAFSTVDRFRHALEAVPGIRDVRARGFQEGTLYLELVCDAVPSYQDLFRRVPGFRCRVLGNTAEGLEVEIEEEEGARSPVADRDAG